MVADDINFTWAIYIATWRRYIARCFITERDRSQWTITTLEMTSCDRICIMFVLVSGFDKGEEEEEERKIIGGEGGWEEEEEGK